MSKKNKQKNLSLDFIPYSEIDSLDSTSRIKKILDMILKEKVVILQGRLKPEEETRLIEDTMAMVGHVKKFRGIELAVINPSTDNLSYFGKFKNGFATWLVGDRSSLTIIGPATMIKEIKKDPKKIELMLK